MGDEPDVEVAEDGQGRKYKELGLAGKELTDEELIQLLAAEPGLWRRPIVIAGGEIVVGYDAERLKKLVSER